MPSPKHTQVSTANMTSLFFLKPKDRKSQTPKPEPQTAKPLISLPLLVCQGRTACAAEGDAPAVARTGNSLGRLGRIPRFP